MCLAQGPQRSDADFQRNMIWNNIKTTLLYHSGLILTTPLGTTIAEHEHMTRTFTYSYLIAIK